MDGDGMGMGLGGAGWVPPAWAVAAGAECPETEGHQLTLKRFGYFSSQMPVVKKNKENNSTTIVQRKKPRQGL